MNSRKLEGKVFHLEQHYKEKEDEADKLSRYHLSVCYIYLALQPMFWKRRRIRDVYEYIYDGRFKNQFFFFLLC